MRPLPFVFPYAVLFWAVWGWAFLPEMGIVRRARRDVAHEASPDAGSLRVVLYGTWLALVAAFPLAWLPSLRFPAGAGSVPFFAGVATMITGALLRRHCWRQLGASFTGDVRARPDQQIVTTGAYAYLRHPSYSAGVLLITGIGIALGSWASSLLLLATTLGVYRYRMAVEERALLAVVGEPYREFMQGRKRIIPFVY